MPSTQHALITGPIAGLIPTPDPSIPHDGIDVTPDVLYFDDKKVAVAVAHAIEDEHWTRGTHPVQVQCAELNAQPDITDAERKAHQALHKDKAAEIEKRAAKHGKAS